MLDFIHFELRSPARNKSDYIFRLNYKIIVNIIALNVIRDYHIICILVELKNMS
jgi:hypothetical protein